MAVRTAIRMVKYSPGTCWRDSASRSATTALTVATEVALASEHRARNGRVGFGASCSQRNDGDGLLFGVDKDLEELSCSKMADRTKEMDGSFVRGSRLESSRMDEKGLQ